MDGILDARCLAHGAGSGCSHHQGLWEARSAEGDGGHSSWVQGEKLSQAQEQEGPCGS